MNKRIGIVLVNYQDYARRFLAPCRDSLRQQDYPLELMRIYIVDNASSAQSLNDLKSIYPEAKIIPRLDGNYAAANNLGFQTALSDGCELLVTVNMDTEMAPGWLRELVLALETDPLVGLAQSKIMLFPQSGHELASAKINSLGNVIHFLGFGFTSGYQESDREILGYPEIKGYASGCSFIIRPEVIAKIQGYNEEYYMYHDDLEISLKAKLAGYKVVLAPLSIIYHKYEFSRSTKMIYYMERNRYLTLLSFYPKYLLVLIFLPALMMDLGMLGYSLLGGWFKEELKIYAYFFRAQNYVKLIQERKKIKALSVRPFRSLASDFSGRIEFQEVANPILRLIVNPLLAAYWFLIKKII